MTRILTIIALLFATPMLGGCSAQLSPAEISYFEKQSLLPNDVAFIWRKSNSRPQFPLRIFNGSGREVANLSNGEIKTVLIDKKAPMLSMQWSGLNRSLLFSDYKEGSRFVIMDAVGGWISPLKLYFVEVSREEWLKRVATGK